MTTTAGTLVRELVRYSGVGVVSTAASLLLYAVLRTQIDVQAANLVATVAIGVANTSANRRFTFGGQAVSWQFQLRGLALLGIGLGLTAVALACLQSVDGTPARVVELGVMTLASLAGGLLRFAVLRATPSHVVAAS